MPIISSKEGIWSNSGGKNLFGYDNPQRDPEINQRTRKTVKDRYVDLMGAVPKEACKKTCLERFGAEHFFASEAGKMSLTNLKERYRLGR